eukprot:m.124845 g.124845  ORF g.124845 m.124845 type:complete len:353 (+) comp37859_c1_seq1:431-1489(+)
MIEKKVIVLLLASGFCLSVMSMQATTGVVKSSTSSALCSSSMETDHAIVTSSCSTRGNFRCGIKSRHYEYCNGESWLSMCPCKSDESLSEKAKSTLGTRINPGRSCDEILLGGGSRGDGAYWIAPKGTLPYEVYCDMTTAGGGWTLTVKVKGNNHIMNRLNTAQWRDGRLIGDTTSLADENAMGTAYTNVPFRDVMIRSVKGEGQHVAWRHPVAFPSIQKIVQKCERVANGAKISGDISLLDFKGDPQYNNPCTELVYGFLGGDWKGVTTTVAGCSTGTAHHIGAVVGAFLEPPSGARSRPGQTIHCISDFGLGGGYHKLGNTIQKYAINAHWWGKGNSVTHSWGTHGLFVR